MGLVLQFQFEERIRFHAGRDFGPATWRIETHVETGPRNGLQGIEMGTRGEGRYPRCAI